LENCETFDFGLNSLNLGGELEKSCQERQWFQVVSSATIVSSRVEFLF
jgi:hypothetical protein